MYIYNIYMIIYIYVFQDIISSRGVPRAIIWDHPVDDPHGGHLLTVPAWRTFSGVSGPSTKLAPCPSMKGSGVSGPSIINLPNTLWLCQQFAFEAMAMKI